MAYLTEARVSVRASCALAAEDRFRDVTCALTCITRRYRKR